MGSRSRKLEKRREKRGRRWLYHWTAVARDAAGALQPQKGGSAVPFSYEPKCLRALASAFQVAPAACIMSPWMPIDLCPIDMNLAPDWRLVFLGDRPVAIIWRREDKEPLPAAWDDLPF